VPVQIILRRSVKITPLPAIMLLHSVYPILHVLPTMLLSGQVT